MTSVWMIAENLSENIYLCINTLQVQNKLFSKLTCFSHAFLSVTKKFVVTLHPAASNPPSPSPREGSSPPQGGVVTLTCASISPLKQRYRFAPSPLQVRSHRACYERTKRRPTNECEPPKYQISNYWCPVKLKYPNKKLG